MSSDWRAPLLASGESSDFTIECQGKVFKVHKLIVCSQSPVIKSALYGEFKEAKTNCVKIDGFDADAVLRMLNFMYGVHDPEEASDDDSSDDGSESASSAVAASEEPAGEPSEEDVLERERAKLEVLSLAPDEQHRKKLISHVWTNAIADYYQVPELCHRANEKIGRIFQNVWSPELFLEIVSLVVSATGDKDLHHMLTQLAVEHVGEYDPDDSLEDLVSLKDFAVRFVEGSAHQKDAWKRLVTSHSYLVQRQAGTIKRLEEQIKSLLANQDLLAVETERKMERAEECVSRLYNTRYCRHCQADFDGYIEVSAFRHFTLRCKRCRTRHYLRGKESWNKDVYAQFT